MNAVPTFEYLMPTRIIHGLGSLSHLGREMRGLGVRRALIVTDPGIRAAGLADRAAAALQEAGVEVVIFDAIGHDAAVSVIDRGSALARAEACGGIVALGGGSALSGGKAVAIMATNPGSIADYEGADKFREMPLPVIAVPTTAGSGSEVSAAMPMQHDGQQRKMSVQSPRAYPRVAILDATLLASVPYTQAIYSGADALTHAMEAYMTRLATPITDALALGAVKMIASNLRQAVKRDDRVAREQTLIGSTMANMACGNAKLGLAHLLTRPINTMFRAVPYGRCIGTLLVPTMAYTASAFPERAAALAGALGEKVEGLPVEAAAGRMMPALKRLLADLDFPRAFSPEDFGAEAIPSLARMCAAGMHGVMADDPSLPDDTPLKMFSLRPATVGDAKRLYAEAMAGWTI